VARGHNKLFTPAGRADERAFLVEEILDQWYGPSDALFKVRADDGNLYILRQDQSTPDGIWSLEAFREVKG
jgi:hypothetical protein